MMKPTAIDPIWDDDTYDVTGKDVMVYFWEGDANGKWEPLHVSIKTDDGRLQMDANRKWIKPVVPVNMKQLRERVDKFLHSDAPIFEDIKSKTFLVIIRENCQSEDFVELAEWW